MASAWRFGVGGRPLLILPVCGAGRAARAACACVVAAALCCAPGFGLEVDWEPSAPGPAMKAPVALADGTLLAAWHARGEEGRNLFCYASADRGASWSRRGVIDADPDRRADIGDGMFLALPDGRVLHAYRRNRHYGPREQRAYSIRVAESRDAGASWRPHSIVAESSGSDRGLWSSFLLLTAGGQLQCYYDDEVTPAREGYAGHQWLTMKRWDGQRWRDPVTVSRAPDPGHLSRDGMCSVVELSPGRLLCVCEGVDVRRPHRGTLYRVSSEDGGSTWSWQRGERPLLYAPERRAYNALAPWMIRLASGPLFCVFTTDEEAPTPGVASTGRLEQNLKWMGSLDGGRSWSAPAVVDAASPLYFPGVCEIAPGVVLVHYLHAGRGFIQRRGMVKTDD